MANTFKFGNGKWAVKDGYALAYNDENGNFKPLPFDFTRATSATRVNKDGLIEVVTNNKPRIDFLDNADGALKLEPQRSNLITYSSDFSQWANVLYTSVESNSTSSPDGSVNADKLVAGATNGLQLRIASASLISGNTYTVSTYVKNAGGNYVILYMNDSSSQGIKVDLINETFTVMGGSTNHFIKNYGNGWYQIGFTRTIDTNVNDIIAVPSLDGNTVSFLGDGINGIYIWGAQVEQGSYATSYIPTQGSAVTVVADGLNTKDISLFSSINFYLFIDMNYISNAPETIFQLDDGASNYIYLYNFRLELQDTLVSTLSLGNNKILIRNDNNNLTAFVNGVQTTSVTRKTILLNNLKLRVNPNSSINFNQVQYGNDITDSEAIALTTI
jgi:hypothetical protein